MSFSMPTIFCLHNYKYFCLVVQVTIELMDLSSKCNLYRQRQLRVLILNPCFWPMRHRPLPLASLPSPLSTFCADYVRFFTAIHEYGLQQHERARKISFTLYGWASLLYKGVRLSLSTVQMIILLQFMEKEVYLHTVQELIQRWAHWDPPSPQLASPPLKSLL